MHLPMVHFEGSGRRFEAHGAEWLVGMARSAGGQCMAEEGARGT